MRFGRRSEVTLEILKSQFCGRAKKFQKVILARGGTKHTWYVHLLIAEAFGAEGG